MVNINFRNESGDEGDTDKLVLEGDIESLKKFRDRLSNVLDVEITKIKEVKFSDGEPEILHNGKKVRFVVKEATEFTKRSGGISRDALIALGIVVVCVVLVMIALFKSKGGSDISGP